MLSSVLAAVFARLAQGFLTRRDRLPGARVCQDSINACNVIFETEILPMGMTTAKAKVAWLQSYPLAFITLVNVCHTPPAVAYFLALATKRHCLLVLKLVLQRLLGNR